jgi:hypothetical protein
VEQIEFRQPNRHTRGTISKVTTPVAVGGETKTMFEVEYDLSDVPLGEDVEFEIEILGRFPITSPRASFQTQIKTDLASVWLLFPTEHPYRSYDLVRYPADKSQTPEIMNARFTIDHPYGSLIGWSVVNPLIDTVYECRWTMQ